MQNTRYVRPRPEQPIDAPEQYGDETGDDEVVMSHTARGQYYGHTPRCGFEFPYLTADAVQLLGERGPPAVGIDGASVGVRDSGLPARDPTTDVGADQSYLRPL